MLRSLLIVASVGAAAASDLAVDQRDLAARYEQLEAIALRIADVAGEDDSERADQIREAIGAARSRGVGERFDAVVRLLEEQRFASARAGQEDLAEQLETLLRVITADPAEQRLDAERRRIERLRREISRAIRSQRSLRRQTERLDGATPPDAAAGIADEQSELGEQVAELAESPPGQESDGLAERLSESGRAMRSASKRLRGGEPQEALGEQRDAQNELEAAARLAEEALRQLREDEQQRRLAGLAERLRSMLTIEQAIVAGLRSASGDASVDRRTRLAIGRLEGQQAEAARAADRAARIVEEDGRSLVFREALHQVVVDMRTLERRLSELRLGAFTTGLAEGIVKSLEEMLAAVDRTLDDLRRRQDERRQTGAPAGGDPGLIGRLEELRMLRSVQARLLRQTGRWREAEARGEATADEVAAGLTRLAQDQGRLAEAARFAQQIEDQQLP